MAQITSRKAWGFSGWLDGVAPPRVAPAQRTEFFVHYDGGAPVGSRLGAQVPRTIHAQHLARGWAGIGYNFVVDQSGQVFEGRGWDMRGSHCPDHNISGLGVQVHIGGDEQPSAAALASVRALYDAATARYGRPLAMRGHRDGYATACPGAALYLWVKAGMPAPTTTTTTEKDLLMTITQATRDEFKALLLGALADNEVAVAFGRAAIGNRYGDQDGDGKADTAGQIIGINSRKLDQLAGKLDQLAGKLDQLAAGK